MIAQQPPATGALAHYAKTATTGGATLLDAIPQGSAPRLLIILSNAGANGAWIMFDATTGAAGLYLASGAAIMLTWPHCPQGAITATGDGGTTTIGIVEGR